MHAPIDANAMYSPRLAPPVFGLGLIESIPEEQILALADVNEQTRMVFQVNRITSGIHLKNAKNSDGSD
jgi:CxxC motif-containing protein (DUF1111 family)